MKTIEVVGHGGAGDFYPGNSRASIQKALEIGVDRIEIDLLRTADGQLALIHDAKIRLDGKRRVPVRHLPTSLLRSRLDELLTLDEFFELIGPTMPVLLDLKQPGYETAVFDALASQPERSVWISTTHARSIAALKDRLPNVRFGLSSGHMATGISASQLRPLTILGVRLLMPLPLVIAARLCGARLIMVNHHACSRMLVGFAHRLGIDVAAWTVNRPAEIERMIGFGVDAIISNRPDLVREALAH